MLLATGVLKGYDALMNLVLDEVEELLRGEKRALLLLNQSLCAVAWEYSVCVN